MTLTEIIKIASEAYDVDGTVMRYHLDPDGDHGDGLAQFIARELAETFDEGSSDESKYSAAVHVMNKACRELSAVEDALRQKWINPPISGVKK